MAAIIIKVKCITNLHVGNGDVNYNIIDNEVERDPVTGKPTINASGVKGALREYFERASGLKPEEINDIFGSSQSGKTTPGRVKILGADFVSMPVRASAGAAACYQVTTQAVIDRYKEMYSLVLKKNAKVEKADAQQNAEGEGIPLTDARKIDGELVYVLDETDFRKLSLPVVARNHLNDGRSEHLWYEEIVPHESRFFFAAIADDKDEDLLNTFAGTVHDHIVQFGGNASVGCGYCRLQVIR